MPVLQKPPSPYYPLGISSNNKKIILPHKVRFVQRDIRLQPFHWLFYKISENARKVCKNIESHKSPNILKLLDEIIPFQYFGIRKNKKPFYKIVKLILTRSVHECIYMRQMINGFNLKAIPWLRPIIKIKNGLNTKLIRQRYFYEAQLWIFEKIVKPIIFRFYVPVKSGQTHEIQLVSRPIWSSFYKKVIHGLEFKGHLIHEPKPTYPRGILQIRPKNGYHNPNDFRPIMRVIPEGDVKRNPKIIKILYEAAKKLCLTKTSNMYSVWKEHVAATEGHNLIYGVKIDLKDAFGNINIDLLCMILEQQCIANKIPSDITGLLINHIQHQFITDGRDKKGNPKRIWKWQHGLLQGDKFSSALCQLYMSYLDSLYLNKFYKPTTILHRTVDDYFFCSTNENEVKDFIDTMTSVHHLNISKTESNLFGHNEISYCGQIFNMHTKQVKSLYNFKKGTEIRYRYKFWNLKRPIFYKQNIQKTIERFLKNPMIIAFNRYRFKNLELNTVFNNEVTFVQNYFEAMIFLAFKFDAAVMAVHNIIKDFSLITTIIKKTVYKYAQRTLGQYTQNKGQYYTGSLSFNVFFKIGIQAFILVLKKRTLYQNHQVTDLLIKYMKKICMKDSTHVKFKDFKSIPKMFKNINISRRVPK